MGQNKLSRNKRTEAARNAITRQPLHTKENRIRKLMKHLRSQPGDKQAEKALNENR